MENEIVVKLKQMVKNESGEPITKVFRDIKTLLNPNNVPDFGQMERGDRFTYGGHEWVLLGNAPNGVVCITAKPIGRMQFDEDGGNNWETSSLRRKLNEIFIRQLDCDDLLAFTSNLVADNGDEQYGETVDYIGLPSCGLYRSFRKYIPKYDDYILTCTPTACDVVAANHVRCVNPDGVFCATRPKQLVGVAPICVFAFHG